MRIKKLQIKKRLIKQRKTLKIVRDKIESAMTVVTEEMA